MEKKNLRLIILFSTLFFYFNNPNLPFFAQNSQGSLPPDSQQWKKKIQMAYDSSDFAALHTIEKQLSGMPLDTTIALCYRRLGYLLHFEQKKTVKGINYTAKALQILGNYDEAIVAEDKAACSFNIATMYQNLNKDSTLFFYEQSIRLREKYKPNSPNISPTYRVLATFIGEQGDLNEALLYHQKAIAEALRQKNREEYINCLNNKGQCYLKIAKSSTGEVAKTAFEQAKKDFTEGLSQNSEIKAELKHNLGNVYSHSGENPTLGIALLKEAASLYKSRNKEEKYLDCCNDLAIAYKRIGKPLEGIKILKRSLYQTSDVLQKASFYDNLGDMYKVQQQYDTAIWFYHQAIAPMVYPALDSNNSYLLPSFQRCKTAKNVNSLYTYLSDKANAWLCYYEQTQKESYLKEAHQTYCLLDSLTVYLRHSFRQDDSKFLLADKSQTMYEKAVETCYLLYQSSNNAAFLTDALHFNEANKGTVLLENRQAKKALSYGNVPSETVQKERTLQIERAYWEKEVADNPMDKNKQDSLFEINRSMTTFLENLEKTYPKYYDLKYADTNKLLPRDIQDKLTQEMVVLEYFLGDSSIYIFAITKKDFFLFKEKISHDFNNRFDKLRNNLSALTSNTTNSDFTDNSSFFYQLLLEKPLKRINSSNNITRLRIIPDGKLSCLPFDSFAKQGADYLIKKYATSYAYSNKSLFSSPSSWWQIIKEYKRSLSNPYLGFGLTYDEATLNAVQKKFGGAFSNIQKKQLLRLENADQHIKGVANLFGGSAVTNEQATLQNFQQKAQEADILELYMHTIYDDKNPLQTSLVFSKDTSEHYLLNTSDIYQMQFHTGLAVLGACNTGLGEIKRGEGIMSLARAFSFADCKSLILTLWSIPEAQTSEILNAFYANLRSGQAKDIALQQAKIAFLTEKGTSEESKPNFWAATICIDDIDAIYWTRGQKVLFFSLVILLFLVPFLLKRKIK